MSVLIYVAGGVAIAVGALTAGRYLRRRAWNELGIRLGSILTGTLLMLSVGDPAIGRLTLIALIALLVWQLASGLTHHMRRRSAS